jgi:hypothetical protein
LKNSPDREAADFSVNLFLSYALGPHDDYIPAQLRATSAAYGLSLLLPDRANTSAGNPNAATRAKIIQSDAVIMLVTITGRPESRKAVESELGHAGQSHKPVIALIEKGLPFQTAPGIHLIYFDRFNPTTHESLFVTALDQIRAEYSKQDLAALAWLAGVAVGLVALSQLSSEEK